MGSFFAGLAQGIDYKLRDPTTKTWKFKPLMNLFASFGLSWLIIPAYSNTTKKSMANKVIDDDVFLTKFVLSGLISALLLGLSSTYAEDLAQVEIDIKNSDGDRTGASSVTFQVYQYSKNTLYTELKPKSDYPYFIVSLPVARIID